MYYIPVEYAIQACLLQTNGERVMLKFREYWSNKHTIFLRESKYPFIIRITVSNRGKPRNRCLDTDNRGGSSQALGFNFREIFVDRSPWTFRLALNHHDGRTETHLEHRCLCPRVEDTLYSFDSAMTSFVVSAIDRHESRFRRLSFYLHDLWLILRSSIFSNVFIAFELLFHGDQW